MVKLIGNMKAIVLILAILLMAAPAMAAPFLVCDPQANTTEIMITFDGVTDIIPYAETGGVVVLKDLAGIANGVHNVEVRAGNIWGLSTPVPFVFTKTLPGSPSNIDLRP